MIQIHVRLHGTLREILPAETNGRTTMSFPERTQISAVLEELSIHRHIQVAVNDEIEDNLDKTLQDGDHLEIFRPSAGG